MNRHFKFKGFIKSVFAIIQTLDDCPTSFDPRFATYAHNLGKRLYPKSPVAQTLFDLYGMGIKKDMLPYTYLLIKTYLARKHTSPNEAVFTHLYKKFTIPKKNGDLRTIESPIKKLKELQRQLLPAFNFALENIYKKIGELGVHGFRKNKSNITNASMHTKKSIVVKLDIENFFSSLYRNEIGQTISIAYYQCGMDEINWLSRYFLVEILSNQNGLPTGAPTSPVLANIYMYSFDFKISSLCKKHNVTYTRYADDLTLSGDKNVVTKIGVVTGMLNSLGLKLNYKKTNIQRIGRRQKVCGLVVNEVVTIGRDKKRQIRAARHYQNTGRTPFIENNPITEIQLYGHEAYIAAIKRIRSESTNN